MKLIHKVHVALALSILPKLIRVLFESKEGNTKFIVTQLLLAYPRLSKVFLPFIEAHNLRFNIFISTISFLSLFFPRYVEVKKIILTLGFLPTLASIPHRNLNEVDLPAVASLLLGFMLNKLDSCLVILIMLTGGEALEEYALQTAGKSLESLLSLTPRFAVLKHKQQRLSLDKIKVDDVLQVNQDEIIPVDGELLGAGSFDENIISGERNLVKKLDKDKVYSGSINKTGRAVYVRCVKPWSESLLFVINQHLKEAMDNQSEKELNAMKMNETFVNITFLLSGLSFWIWFGKMDDSHRIEIALSVLMSATTCPLQIGVPVCFLAGMSKIFTKYGCTVKSASTIEDLCDIDHVVFDKTGTLTNGSMSVTDFIVEENDLGLREETLVEIIGNLQLESLHPYGKAFVKFAQLDKAETVTDLEIVQGAGIVGRVRGYKVKVGQFSKKNWKAPKLCAGFQIIGEDDNMSYGKIYFKDELRHDAIETIQRLKPGFALSILSGDRSQNLSQTAAKLGIDDFHACLPNDKVSFIKLAQSTGKSVLFVGDGLNDSGAMMQTDVSLSLNKESAVSDVADIVLRNGKLINIVNILDESKRIINRSSILVNYGMLASSIQMVLATFGIIDSFQAACGQELVDMLSTTYALMAIR